MTSDIDRLAAGFVACTLPKEEWTHEAHLRVGLWHVLRHNPGEALALLRERIRRYNESVGGVNSASSGYHETITRFYVGVIAAFVAGCDRARPIDALADDLIADRGDRDLPLRYWSRERLMSAEARAAWVGPDLRPLEFEA
jgi:hypothetical protein